MTVGNQFVSDLGTQSSSAVDGSGAGSDGLGAMREVTPEGIGNALSESISEDVMYTGHGSVEFFGNEISSEVGATVTDTPEVVSGLCISVVTFTVSAVLSDREW